MMATVAEQWQGTAGIEGRKFDRVMEAARQAYLDSQYTLSPQDLAQQFKELDPWAIQDALDMAGWEMLSGYGQNTTAERQRAVKESLRMWKYNPLHQWSVWLWTSWGLGESVQVDIVRPEPVEDDPVAVAWNECWEAPRNAQIFGDDSIHELSDWLLNYGNSFLVQYISQQDGASTWDELPYDEITEIVRHPSTGRPLFYKREFTVGTGKRTWYYPHDGAYFDGSLDEPFPGDEQERTLAEVVLPVGAIRADTQRRVGDDEETLGEKVGTEACVLHVSHNRKERRSLWGWPLSTSAWRFLSAHKKFADARLAVAQAKAAFVRRKQYEGGSRAGKSLLATISSNLGASQYTDTNPSQAPGSTDIDNAMVTTTDLPMTTGASDARTDNSLFAWMALLGEGLFPTTAGLDTSRWATAVEMDKAQSMLFSRYQTFWRAQLERIVLDTIKAKEKFGNLTPGEYTVEVSVDTFSLADFPSVGKAIGQVVKDLLMPAVEVGVIPGDTAKSILATLWRINLQALGINAAREMTTDEAWEIGIEEETPEEPEPEPQEPEEPESALSKVAAELGQAMAAGDVALSEALTWAIATAAEG